MSTATAVAEPPLQPHKQKALSLKLYRGDAKTLLAFNLPKAETADLAGFTIQVKPPGKTAYYIYNNLQFEDPSKHAQVKNEPAYSSVNAPIHMFRWVHVPGSAHQGVNPVWGDYIYTVTPRYFDGHGSMLPLDPSLGQSETIKVAPYENGNLAIAFTRGYTQSQAFVRHFSIDALISPKNDDPFFDTSGVAGTNSQGKTFTFAEEYEWMGFTARERIMAILDEVVSNTNLSIDIFAYDLGEPDLTAKLLKIPKSRIRIILDNARLHKTSTTKSGKTKVSHEDAFETEFRKKHGGASAPIHRGHFGRYSHDKVFIVSDSTGPAKVLTGSTNFSVTGMYVNSNHILVFEDRKIAQKYRDVFDESWNDATSAAKFKKSPLSAATGFDFASLPGTPHVTFSPHNDTGVQTILGDLVARISKEGKKSSGSVMFAVMELDGTPKKSKNGQPSKPAPNMVFDALNTLHANQNIFSYGVSDNPKGVYLYKPGSKQGVLVTGKPTAARLPAPFNQIRYIGGIGHQVHHKFVVCGFNTADAVVYCGSSNLAEGGEKVNGDNLLALHGPDIATVFAIEAVSLVDHFNFLDNVAGEAKKSGAKTVPETPVKTAAAAEAHWYLSTDDKWAAKFYNKNDLKCADRELFA